MSGSRKWPVVALTAALVLVFAGCSDDKDKNASAKKADKQDFTEVCKVAREINGQDSFPTPDQIRRYQKLAPEETSNAAKTFGNRIIAAGDDMVATFKMFAEDENESFTRQMNAWEAENCGIEYDKSETEPEAKIDTSATRVDVSASEFTFKFAAPIRAGRTSFVLTNSGGQAHFMGLAQILPGHTMEEALAFEGDPEEAGLMKDAGDTGLAAVGGEDEEVLNADLAPGNYAMVCFIPGPDGTPHALSGMAVPFTVT